MSTKLNEKIELFELGTTVFNTLLLGEGHLTTACISEDRSIRYWYQPNELLPNGALAEKTHCVPNSIEQGTKKEYLLPLGLLGHKVSCKHTGFTGIAVQITVHQNGCIHVWVQPQRVDEKGGLVDPVDFDIIELVGDVITGNEDELVYCIELQKPVVKEKKVINSPTTSLFNRL